MWKYWTLLSDLRQSEIAQMQADVASGALHPMQAKKNLAHAITQDFHSAAEADAAAANWARQFQQGGVSEQLESAEVAYENIAGQAANTLRVAKLLVQTNLAGSASEAVRKMSEGAVHINQEIWKDPVFTIPGLPVTLTVRLGKRAKLAVIS
jgi:tyrosyl-tRNA synthetase